MDTRITLHPGERIVAQIIQDREVAILAEALWGVLGVLAVSTALFVFDSATGQPGSGVSFGTLATLAFLFGPIAAQRLMRPMPVYWVTNHRVMLDNGSDIRLTDIRRIRVWLTRLTLQTDTQKCVLHWLVNPAAVAVLLRDTIASKEGC